MTDQEATMPEPLVMTLEEAMKTVADRGWTLVCRGTSPEYPASRWLVIGERANTLGEGRVWRDAVSTAIGRTVIERDPCPDLYRSWTELNEAYYAQANKHADEKAELVKALEQAHAALAAVGEET